VTYCRSQSFAGQLAGLLHPSGELSFVELLVPVDVEVAHFLLLALAGGEWTQRRAVEESHLDLLRDAMDAEALDAIEGRVPSALQHFRLERIHRCGNV